jgi:hypothetical protein
LQIHDSIDEFIARCQQPYWPVFEDSCLDRPGEESTIGGDGRLFIIASSDVEQG